MSTFIKFLLAALLALTVLFIVRNQKQVLDDRYEPVLHLDTVRRGIFQEWIPQTGIVVQDTLDTTRIKVNVEIDELYLDRISPGLKGTTHLNEQEYELVIVGEKSAIVNGRFRVDMEFVGEAPESVQDQRLRLRIMLSGAEDAIVMSIGGFFKDTRGEWIYRVGKDSNVVKHPVRLGRHNTEEFEVLAGLSPGDVVVTSSYELYGDRERLSWVELTELLERPWWY